MPDYSRIVLEHLRASSKALAGPKTFLASEDNNWREVPQAYRRLVTMVHASCESEPPTFGAWKNRLELIRTMGAVSPADSVLMQPGGSVYMAVEAFYSAPSNTFPGWKLRLCKDVRAHGLNSARVLTAHNAYKGGHPGYRLDLFDKHEAPLKRIELVHPTQGAWILWEN